MRKTAIEVVEQSPWRKAEYARSYFQLSRNMLDSIAIKADAKKKAGKTALYHIPRIEAFIENGGGADDGK